MRAAEATEPRDRAWPLPLRLSLRPEQVSPLGAILWDASLETSPLMGSSGQGTLVRAPLRKGTIQR